MPGCIYAHSNEFNEESSPWSNILSGTSSLSPSPAPASLHLTSSSLTRLLIVKWQRMLQFKRADLRDRERERTGKKDSPESPATVWELQITLWDRGLENFISLFIIKLLNLNLTVPFSCWGLPAALIEPYLLRGSESIFHFNCGSPYSIITAIHGRLGDERSWRFWFVPNADGSWEVTGFSERQYLPGATLLEAYWNEKSRHKKVRRFEGVLNCPALRYAHHWVAVLSHRSFFLLPFPHSATHCCSEGAVCSVFSSLSPHTEIQSFFLSCCQNRERSEWNI